MAFNGKCRTGGWQRMRLTGCPALAWRGDEWCQRADAGTGRGWAGGAGTVQLVVHASCRHAGRRGGGRGLSGAGSVTLPISLVGVDMRCPSWHQPWGCEVELGAGTLEAMQRHRGREPRLTEFVMGFYINKEKYQPQREFVCGCGGWDGSCACGASAMLGVGSWGDTQLVCSISWVGSLSLFYSWGNQGTGVELTCVQSPNRPVGEPGTEPSCSEPWSRAVSTGPHCHCPWEGRFVDSVCVCVCCFPCFTEMVQGLHMATRRQPVPRHVALASSG